MIRKSMQEAYGKTLERQSEAAGKKGAAAATSRSSRSATLRRSARNAESSSSRDITLPPIAEETETQVIPVTHFAELQIQSQSSQHQTNASTVKTGSLRSLISSSDKLVWGRFGPRTQTSTNARHAAARRANRLERFIHHLQNSNQNDDEVHSFSRPIYVVISFFHIQELLLHFLT